MSTIADAYALGKPLTEDPAQGQMDIANGDAVAQEATNTITEGAQARKAADLQQAPFDQITHKWNPKTGKYDVSVDMAGDTFDYLGNLIQTGQAAQSAFQQARAEVMAKRQFQEQNPILAGVGKIASTAAAQYGTGQFGGGRGRDISPIIRAAGAYGLEQFGQTNQELAQQEAGLSAQEFGIATTLYNQEQQDAALRQAAVREARRDKISEAQLALQGKGLEAELARDKANRENQLRDDVQTFTNKVIDTARANRNFSPAEAQATIDQAVTLGYTPEQAAALVERTQQIAVSSQVKWEADVKAGIATDVRRARLKDESDAKATALKTTAALQLLDAKTEALLKTDANKAAIKAASAGQKVSESAKKAWVQMAVVEKNIEEVRQVVRDHPDYFGLVGGTVTKASSLIDPTSSGNAAAVQHLFAQLAKGYGGARGFSKVEQPVFKDLAGSVFNEPEALEAKLVQIENWVVANRDAWKQLEPGLAHFGAQAAPATADPAGILNAKP